MYDNVKTHYTLKVGDNIMKILLLTLDEHEEKAQTAEAAQKELL